MKVLLSFLMLSALVLTAADTDISGKWSGSFKMNGPDGQTKDGTALLVLKQKGTEISGTVGPSEEEQMAIQKGSIEGGKINLEVTADSGTIKFALVVAGDHITGDASMQNGDQKMTAKLDVTRAK
jgi:hypothetical protein